MSAHSHAVDLVRQYLSALERGDTGEALRGFFTPDAEQTEWPNRLNPRGQVSDVSGLLARSVQGAKVLRSQNYNILTAISFEDRVAVEATWTGTLAIPLGTLAPGETMTAHFAMFFELRDGRIFRQRNYDCFEPW